MSKYLKNQIRKLHKELEYQLVSYRRNVNNKGVDKNIHMIPVSEDSDIEQLYWLVHDSDLVNDLKHRLLVRIVDNFQNEYALKELTGINFVQNALDNKLNYDHGTRFEKGEE